MRERFRARKVSLGGTDPIQPRCVFSSAKQRQGLRDSELPFTSSSPTLPIVPNLRLTHMASLFIWSSVAQVVPKRRSGDFLLR